MVIFLRQITELIDKIIEIEREANPKVKESVLNEIRAAGATATHMYVASWDFFAAKNTCLIPFTYLLACHTIMLCRKPYVREGCRSSSVI